MNTEDSELRAEVLETWGWRAAADAARTTVHREPGEGEPTSSWKRRMLLCEHSPIRHVTVRAKWHHLRYWVSVHLVRHKVGIEHFVRTQRSDRTGSDREVSPQGTPVEHEVLVNAQAMINISRRRLCRCASPETREAWTTLLKKVGESEPELGAACVPDCVYRGWCYEHRSCGWHLTEEYARRLSDYREGINQWRD